jgi:hypothetical protein
MYGIAPYLLAGTLMVLVTDFVVPPFGFGLEVRARPVAETNATTQFVDRTHKGDRLSLRTINTQPTPTQSPPPMVGCDLQFSPLLPSARAHGPGRCIS